MENKRIHQRFHIIEEDGKPTQYNMFKHGIPGILLDLSAGGMSFRSYGKVEPGEKIVFAINIPDIATQEIEGKVEWVELDGMMWRVGISFTKIGKEDIKHINKVAEDHDKGKNNPEDGK